MELVLDRFAVNERGDAVDLATGELVQVRWSTAGGPAEQAIWAARCARFAALRHRAIARLIDFGISGEMRRMEAWAATTPWTGRRAAAVAAVASANAFLRGEGMSAVEEEGQAVFCADHAAVVVPGAGCGIPREPRLTTSDAVALADAGVSLDLDPRVAALGELFAHPGAARVAAISLYGPDPMLVDAAACAVIRAARLAGVVPVSGTLLQLPRFEALVRGRTLLVVFRGDEALQWDVWLSWVLRAPQPHSVLCVGRRAVDGAHGVLVRRLSEEALAASVRPATSGGPRARRIAAAARHADGLLSRFCGRLWGVDVRAADEPAWPVARVAETPASYTLHEHGDAATPASTDAAWPASGELARFRSQAQTGAVLLRRGRFAPGARLVRQAMAALARRGDWCAAARSAITLADELAVRGHSASAEQALDEARGWATHARDEALLLEIAILSGRIRCDLGRLADAQVVLDAACAVAGSTRSPHRTRALLALARCLYWQGRYDEAWDCLGGAAITPDAVDATAWHGARSRVAAARGQIDEAIAEAATARDLAMSAGDARRMAAAWYVTALAQLAAGDHGQADAAAARAAHAARHGHHLMLAVCARVLSGEVARRQGRTGAAARVASRFTRVSASRLPLLVRARVDLLREAIQAPDPIALGERRATASGLQALPLFLPRRPRHVSRQAADEIAALLHCAHAADEDVAVLTAVCARLRGRLRAAAIACVTEAAGQPVFLAGDGGRVDAATVARIFAVGQLVLPHPGAERVEGGVPVRYAGRCVGAVAVRWAPGVPVDVDDLAVLLTAGAAAAAPALASAAAARVAAAAPRLPELLGVSAGIADVRAAVERASAAPFAVLIEGESGSGKEMVARSLHRLGPRRDRTFCTLNCAALPDDLVESELFGHARGAFTGASAERQGVFEEAHGGTLFLDEVGELSLRAQAKLLRAIQEGEIRRLGENAPRRVDVRLIAATNRDLRTEVGAGRFRLDLLYRLDVVRIVVPPLRERRDDVPVLVEHFWRDATARVGSKAVLGAPTLAALVRHDWPGNIRELQNVLASLVVRAGRRGVVMPSALPPPFGARTAAPGLRLDTARRHFEEHFIRAALVRAGGRRTVAAAELGLTRQGLAKLMARLGVEAQHA